MKRIRFYIFIISLPFVFLNSNYAQTIDESDTTIVIAAGLGFENTSTAQVPIDSLIALGKTYLGLPYRTTVRAPWPLDCSGYVSMLYGHYGVKLPHSSGGIADITQKISLKEAQPGDLLFFKGRDSRKNRVGHVALIIEVHEDYVLMMHSTNSKGIIIEQYPDGYYYTKRFIKAGRLQ